VINSKILKMGNLSEVCLGRAKPPPRTADLTQEEAYMLKKQ